MQRTGSRWMGIGLLALALISGMYYVAQGRTPTVQGAFPQRGDVVQAVYATGTVEATVMLPIAPRNTARLMELHADEGSQVQKGALLAQLEDHDLLQTLHELEAREDYAHRELERKERLQARGVAARETLDQARTEWKAASAAVKRAQTQLNYMKLLAPEDGRIIRRDGEIGQLIPANQPVFWMACCAPLRVSADVDEEDIPLVQPGQKVFIRADAFPGQVFHGQVQAITPKGDPVARSYRVRIGFHTPDVPLWIGMTAEVNIITREKKNALLVPRSAIQEAQQRADTQETTLWVVNASGRLQRQAVTLGVQGDEQVEVTAGIHEQTQIVHQKPDDLNEGDVVRLVKP